jgi:acyl carrier protein
MTADRITQRVVAFFHETLAQDITGTSVDLIRAGVLDSLAFVELVLFLEQEFAVSVPLDEFELDNFRTVKIIAAFIEMHQAKPDLPANDSGVVA